MLNGFLEDLGMEGVIIWKSGTRAIESRLTYRV